MTPCCPLAIRGNTIRYGKISIDIISPQIPGTLPRDLCPAPAGSVYWFDQLEGEAGKLAACVAGGLWGDNHDKQRRAEGFNRAWLAHWKETQ